MAGSALYRRAVVLGLTIAVGAFAIDMYIPGFAAIARQLHTDAGTVQLSMTSFFVALALGQVIYGPVSDTFGRKRPSYVGLVIFIIASVGAAFAPSIQFLILSRFFQGLGAAATAVIPMAIVRDEYTGPDAARLLSLAMLALSVSPILAPVMGGLVVQYLSWRLNFVILIVIAALVMVMIWRMLPETLPPERRVSGRLLSILSTYVRLLRQRIFILPVLIAASAQSVLFCFISGSPFVFVTLHHLAPTIYGMLFAVHAMVLIGISQFNAPMMRWFGTRRLLGFATGAAALAGLLLAILVFSGMTILWPFVALTLTLFLCLGLIMGPAFLTAMEPFGATAGAAAALAVGLEFTMSSVTTALMSTVSDGTARPMVASMAVVACCGFAIWCVFMKLVPPAARFP
ncbi:multidrug effflux MFS transporter [Acidisoma cellulosilytica]|uniref:Bcr/CflA family efflux transporter n=1 Tax=Acidisoma cellulosilyticum TaxID=2802395 RepID=A0A964E2C2_9PROT|nr:multidrug effflux MFS transporter [Acidisoma cellulosilyticum]MCB8879271.1 multidrug effflux MFS transporter [Acidisoma cellulosilyticum]